MFSVFDINLTYISLKHGSSITSQHAKIMHMPQYSFEEAAQER